MNLTVDPDSTVSIYVQIAEHLKSAIISGEFAVGQRLPSVRRLAEELGVSRLTVFNAYSELRQQGLVTGRAGGGTVVDSLADRQTSQSFLSQYTSRGPLIQFEETCRSGNVRSLATAVADPGLFDAETWLADMFELRRSSKWAFYLPNFLGEQEFLVAAHRITKRYLPNEKPDSLVTIGRSVELLARMRHGLLDEGSHVLLQEPNNLGAENVYEYHGLVPHAVRVDVGGIDLDEMKEVCKRWSPKAAFVQPTFGFAGGTVWPTDNRIAFLNLADKYGVAVFELMNAVAIEFGDRNLRPSNLATLAPNLDVITSMNLMDAVAPGIGVGVASMSSMHRTWLERSRLFTGMPVNRAPQLTAAKMIRSGHYDGHFSRAVPQYRKRRDALVSALRRYLPEVSCHVAEGGLSLYVGLPVAIDAVRLFESSLKAGVAVMPGRYLTTEGRGSRNVRLSYGMLQPGAIERAVEQWAPVLRKEMRLSAKMGPCSSSTGAG